MARGVGWYEGEARGSRAALAIGALGVGPLLVVSTAAELVTGDEREYFAPSLEWSVVIAVLSLVAAGFLWAGRPDRIVLTDEPGAAGSGDEVGAEPTVPAIR